MSDQPQDRFKIALIHGTDTEWALAELVRLRADAELADIRMGQIDAMVRAHGRCEAEMRERLERIAEAAEDFVSEYRNRYARSSRGGVRADAPMREEVAALNSRVQIIIANAPPTGSPDGR